MEQVRAGGHRVHGGSGRPEARQARDRARSRLRDGRLSHRHHRHFEQQLDARSGSKDRRAIADCIRGMEKKQLPHLLCTTNLMLHGIEVPSMIEHRNTLARGWNEWAKGERVDCVITNPPFGGMEAESSGNDYLLQARETADMCI
jgi:hypothetical protein